MGGIPSTVLITCFDVYIINRFGGKMSFEEMDSVAKNSDCQGFGALRELFLSTGAGRGRIKKEQS